MADNGNDLTTTTKQADLWEIVKSLQPRIGGGRAKMARILVIFDEHGNMVGKSQVEIVELYPHGIGEFLRKVFEG